MQISSRRRGTEGPGKASYAAALPPEASSEEEGPGAEELSWLEEEPLELELELELECWELLELLLGLEEEDEELLGFEEEEEFPPPPLGPGSLEMSVPGP